MFSKLDQRMLIAYDCVVFFFCVCVCECVMFVLVATVSTGRSSVSYRDSSKRLNLVYLILDCCIGLAD